MIASYEILYKFYIPPSEYQPEDGFSCTSRNMLLEYMIHV
jgi:hypothetical protein